MADDLGEKSEDATPKRRQESREEGQVAKSQDLSGAILLTAVVIAMALAVSWMLDQGRVVMGTVLAGDAASNILHPDSAMESVLYVGGAAVRIITPLLLVAWAAAFASQLGQVGWLFAPKSVQPKLSKINPLSGFKRIFGLSGLVKAALDALKVLVVVTILVFTVRQHLDRILVMSYLGVLECLSIIGSLLFDLALRLLAVLILLGIVDYSYQRWKRSQELKMTKQQVKDEMKQTEGDPEVKRRRMRIQQQIAAQRVSSAVPKADVIVTNPEHLAIAIKYDSETMNAPIVLAKGADHLALRIRQIGLRHNIPIIERKPLARALYKQVAAGQEIPPDFYTAVAEVLAYVYGLSGKMAS